MTTQMAKKPDKGQTGGPIDQNQAGTSPKLRLVPPINHTPNTSLPPDLALIPTSDLTLLLSDPTILKRYRAGRYKQGTNTALRIGWIPEFSSAVSHIGGKCSPRAATDTFAALSIHIAAMDMLEWTSVQSLSATRDRYSDLIPSLSLTTIHLVSSLLAVNFRPIGQSRTIIVPHCVDDDLSRVAASTGITKSIAGTLCLAYTISSQPTKYLHKRMVQALSEVALETRHWLRWKAKSSEEAIDEFERFSEEIKDPSTEDDI